MLKNITKTEKIKLVKVKRRTSSVQGNPSYKLTFAYWGGGIIEGITQSNNLFVYEFNFSKLVGFYFFVEYITKENGCVSIIGLTQA